MSRYIGFELSGHEAEIKIENGWINTRVGRVKIFTDEEYATVASADYNHWTGWVDFVPAEVNKARAELHAKGMPVDANPVVTCVVHHVPRFICYLPTYMKLTVIFGACAARFALLSDGKFLRLNRQKLLLPLKIPALTLVELRTSSHQ